MKILDDIFEELEMDKKYIPFVMIIVVVSLVVSYLEEKFSVK